MPAIDMTVVLTDERGQPMKNLFGLDPSDPDVKAKIDAAPDLTLGHLLAHALFQSYTDEPHLSGGAKWARGVLGMKVMSESSVIFNSDELGVVKRLVERFGVGVIFCVMPVLFPDDLPGPIA